MSPVHFNDEPMRLVTHFGELFEYFMAPEVPRGFSDFLQIALEPSADVFAMGMLFLFLLLPITDGGEPSTEFRNLARQIQEGDTPTTFPASLLIREPNDLIQPLWDLIRTMISPREQRPRSVEILQRLISLTSFAQHLNDAQGPP